MPRRHFPPPWSVEENRRVLHRPRCRWAGARLLLFRGGARPSLGGAPRHARRGPTHRGSPADMIVAAIRRVQSAPTPWRNLSVRPMLLPLARPAVRLAANGLSQTNQRPPLTQRGTQCGAILKGPHFWRASATDNSKSCGGPKGYAFSNLVPLVGLSTASMPPLVRYLGGADPQGPRLPPRMGTARPGCRKGERKRGCGCSSLRDLAVACHSHPKMLG
jgi:hypothetical protein